MIKIFSSPSSKTLTVAINLSRMVVRETPIELACAVISYLFYLYTKQNEWLYYGIPMVCILHCLNGTKYYYATPFIYILFLSGAYYAGFPNTLFLTSMLTALVCLCLNGKVCISSRIYQLGKHLLTAFYCTAFLLLASVFLYIIASAVLTIPDLPKEVLTRACIFIFSVVLPTCFLATDNRRRKEPITIPQTVKWIQLTLETLIQIGTIYLVFCIIQMTLRSLTPRPYVVYIAIATIITIEISAKLHDWSPKNWNNRFFLYRNLLYVPLILLGIAALYIEYSLVGYRPRTLAAFILLGWISIICIARLAGFRYIKTKERLFSVCISIILTIAIYISTVTTIS